MGNEHVNRDAALVALYNRQPNLLWAHPFALLLSEIPMEVSKPELLEAFREGPEIRQGEKTVKVFPLQVTDASKTWRAIIHVENPSNFEYVVKRVKSSQGIRLPCAAELPWIKNQLELANTKLEEAEAEHKVHPCPSNSQKVAEARKEYKEAQTGLRINDKEHHSSGHVL
jgi:hypothetical protein